MEKIRRLKELKKTLIKITNEKFEKGKREQKRDKKKQDKERKR